MYRYIEREVPISFLLLLLLMMMSTEIFFSPFITFYDFLGAARFNPKLEKNSFSYAPPNVLYDVDANIYQ